MKNSTNSKSKRNIMAITILCILGVLSVAYAAFSTNLKIGLQGTADNKWNIQFAAKTDNTVDMETLTHTICDSDDPAAGTASWTYTGKQTNIKIDGLKFVNLDDKIYYLFTIQNTGDVTAKLTTLPAFPKQEETHSYLSASGEDVNYTVTYKGDFYIAGDDDSANPTQKPNASTLSTFNTPLATGTTLDPGTQKYIILKVYATYEGDGITTKDGITTIPGNTTFTGKNGEKEDDPTKQDKLNFTIDAGTWESDSTITADPPPIQVGS